MDAFAQQTWLDAVIKLKLDVPESVKAATNPLVAVVGVGGVGSHCAHGLVRSGIRRIRLIDFDRVSLSSLNRHAVARRSDVGIPKVTACAARFAAIAPDCQIEECNEMFRAEAAPHLLLGEQADCTNRHGLRVLSALGSGAKGDPTKLCMAQGLQDVTSDPIAADLRTTLRKRSVDVSKVWFAYSSQKADRQLLPLSEEQRAQPSEFGNVKSFRLRVIPVLGSQPALSGVTLASKTLAVIRELGVEFRQIPAPSRSFAEKLVRQLHQRKIPVDLSVNEAMFLVQEVWHGRSALSSRDQAIAARCGLARWDLTQPANLGNTILATEAEVEAHEGPQSVVAPLRELIETRLRWAVQSWSPCATPAESCVALNRSPSRSPATYKRRQRSEIDSNDAGSFEKVLVEEQLSRSAAFLGPSGHSAVCSGFAVVVGVGSVGSAAASLLLRAGIGHLRLIDDAVVREGHCHAVSSAADEGLPKAQVARRAFQEIFPASQIEVVLQRFTEHTAASLLSPSPDGHEVNLVLECTGCPPEGKAAVVSAAATRKIRVITAVPSAGLLDPTRITLCPLPEVWLSPAAVALRLAVPDRAAAAATIVVHSSEHAQWQRSRPPVGSWEAAAESLVRFNIGLTCAAAALHILAGEPLPEAAAPGSVGAWKKLERALRMPTSGKSLDIHAIGCVVEQVWHGRSALSGRLGSTTSLDTISGLQLVHWDVTEPVSLWNLVLMTEEEALAHKQHHHLPRTLDQQQLRAHENLQLLRRHVETEAKIPLRSSSSALLAKAPFTWARVEAFFFAAMQRSESLCAPTLVRAVLASSLFSGLSCAVIKLLRVWQRRKGRVLLLPSQETVVDSSTVILIGFAVFCAAVQKLRSKLWPTPGDARASAVLPSLRILDSGFAGLVGNTPLIELRALSAATGGRVVGKAEFLSPGGCQKDRVAVSILAEAEATGRLQPGSTIVEGTSGSTGISLTLAARSRGYKVLIVMPDDQAEEKVQLLRRLGAEVELVRPASIVSPDHYVNVARRRAHELDATGGLFADQFENLANYKAHFEGTGPELWEQCDHRLDAFVMSAGTGGTIVGTGSFLKQQAPEIGVYLADVPGSSLLRKVTHGVLYAPEQQERTVRRHRTDTIAEGIGLDRLTANFAKGLAEHNPCGGCIDGAVYVSDQEALEMARFLLDHEGLFLGSSAAVNCAAACKVAWKLGPGHTVATVLCDSGLRHLSKFHNPAVWPEFGLSAPPPRAREDLSFLKRT